MFFPLIWFEQKVRISPKLAINIRLLPIMVILGQVLFAIMLIVGMMMICWYTIKRTATQCWTKSKTLTKTETSETKSGQCRSEHNVGATSLPTACRTESEFTTIKPLLVELKTKLTPESRLQDTNNGSSM